MDSAEMGELKAAVDMYATQYTATDKLWAYFSSVTLAVLGLAIASDKFSKSFFESMIVISGYVIFCLGNFNALSLSQSQLIEFAAIARSVAEKHKVSLTSVTPLSNSSIRLYYWSVVCVFCLGVLFITWYRGGK